MVKNSIFSNSDSFWLVNVFSLSGSAWERTARLAQPDNPNSHCPTTSLGPANSSADEIKHRWFSRIT